MLLCCVELLLVGAGACSCENRIECRARHSRDGGWCSICHLCLVEMGGGLVFRECCVAIGCLGFPRSCSLLVLYFICMGSDEEWRNIG